MTLESKTLQANRRNLQTESRMQNEIRQNAPGGRGVRPPRAGVDETCLPPSARPVAKVMNVVGIYNAAAWRRPERKNRERRLGMHNEYRLNVKRVVGRHPRGTSEAGS